MLVALERVSGRSIDPARRTPARWRPRPRIAVMSPMPPLSARGSPTTPRGPIEYLAEHYAIDVYRDSNYVPFLELQDKDFGCYDHRLFERIAPARNYRAVLYQMGNHSFHRYIYDRLDRWPGLVTLHDFSLVLFHELVRHAARRGAGRFPPGLRGLRPAPARRRQAAVGGGRRLHPRGSYRPCIEQMLFLNRKVFDASLGVIVHSCWCQQQAERLYPRAAGQTYVVSLGAKPEVYAEGCKAAIRQQFDVPAGCWC